MENSLFKQARENTIQARLKQSSEKIHKALIHLTDIIKSRSLQGKDSTSVQLSILNINRMEAESLINHPELSGFKCSVESERISEDSPIQFYQADVFKVSWE